MKRAAVLTLLSAIAAGASCAPSGFEGPTKIDTVRILASRADGDESYAKPGDTVTLETLTVDGRSSPSTPVVTYWIPYLCQNPTDDVYAACFVPPSGTDAGASDGGAGGLGAILQPGDLKPLLPTGNFTFTVPKDIITRHPVVAGAPAPYGLIIVFNVACAGRVHFTGIAPAGGPQQIPLSCVDDAGNALGPDDYVIGFTRVYVFDNQTNPNPEIDGIIINGVETSTNVGGTALPLPVAITLPACHGGCGGVTLDMDVPLSSWSWVSQKGSQHKAVWVDYYATAGGFDGEARLIYDQTSGRVSGNGSVVRYTPPDAPGPATLWAVVHDANDGVTWLQVNITAQ